MIKIRNRKQDTTLPWLLITIFKWLKGTAGGIVCSMRKSDRWGVSRPAATAIGLFAALLGVVWAREDARPATQGADDPRMGQLVVGQNTDGRLEIFRVAPDGELRHRWQKASNGEWSSWAGLGGSLAPGIAAAQAADGGLAVLAVD